MSHSPAPRFYPALLAILLPFAAVTFPACDDDGDNDLPDVVSGGAPADVDGFRYVEIAGGSLDTLYGDAITALEAAGPVTIVAEVDHAAAADGVGLELRPTRVVLFGNPALGTPLMQANPQAGLDLPQKLAFYEAADSGVVVAYNAAEYLASRHGLPDTLTQLGTIAGALANFAAGGSGEEIREADDLTVERDEGIVTRATAESVDSVYARLRGLVDANANLRIVAELDHAANAASVDLELAPSKLLVFGNPNLGTPLMQAGQSVAVDLPQKFLVFDRGDSTVVAYNDPAYLAARHGLPDDLPQLQTVSEALAGLAAGATGQ